MNTLKTVTSPKRSQIVLAFAAIYLIWGSTYLGIRIAIETIPPFTMAGARFVLAGVGLYAWQRWKGAAPLAAGYWRDTTLLGALMVGIGNGGVTFACQKVPSGLTALLIAGTPFWIALLDWVRPGGDRPAMRTLAGIVVGFAGISLLVSAGQNTAGAIHLTSLLALALSSIAWSAGSVYSRQVPAMPSPLLGIGAQMIMGGIFLLAFAVLAGEAALFEMDAISLRSLAAFIYLMIFGAMVGFTAYSWLLTVSTPARVATYAYVNPVIAVLLGAMVADEPLTPRILGAAVIILLGVGIISQRGRGRKSTGDRTSPAISKQVPATTKKWPWT